MLRSCADSSLWAFFRRFTFSPEELIWFFRNLLLGEHNELKSRYLLVGGWQGDGLDPTSNPTSKKAVQSPVKLRLSLQVRRLLSIIEGEVTRATLMKALGLKDRVTFMNSYLSPCLKIGLVETTQPNSPRSPTQRYRLTAKGRCADV